MKKLVISLVLACGVCVIAYSQSADSQRALTATKSLMYFSRIVDNFYVQTGCKRPNGFPSSLTTESLAYAVEKLGPNLDKAFREALADPRGSNKDELVANGWLDELARPKGLEFRLDLDKAYVKEFGCNSFGQYFIDGRSRFRREFTQASRPSRP